MSPQRAFVNGILHLIVLDMGQPQMVAVDVQGKTKKIITMPAVAEGRCWYPIPYIGQSQGRLHYINHDFDFMLMTLHGSRAMNCPSGSFRIMVPKNGC